MSTAQTDTDSSKFNSILVANRGEIAVRVIRTARALGYRTIAVHSEPDAAAPHVKLADDAAAIGPAAVSESYLNIERILDAARATGAEAIHPGYGFLSENADFARACEDAGIVFIGPTPDAIDAMGNKARAKRRMIEAGVPCVPGYEGEDQSDEHFIEAAERIGYPVMVKAAAGGGGRGMRLVADERELRTALELARPEAASAFGSDELILEKAIVRPRHVEVQVFADLHGNAIHLGERDCSIQRRHQKVIEEAPCPIMTDGLREAMGRAGVDAAKAIEYRGAGTVEFLLDESGEFYFLEMNTRLQVEHPVTELVTGSDLVAMQIRVAQGQALDITQDDVRLHGHAIEARLYAEDPSQGFIPSTGTVELWHPPAGAGIRVDAGIETGSEISPFYDAMVAKIIAWGENRATARRRLIDALENTGLFGVRTNRDFLIRVLLDEQFADGNATTAFIGERFTERDLAHTQPEFEQAAVAAVLQYVDSRRRSAEVAASTSGELSNWSSSGTLTSYYSYDAAGADFELSVSPVGPNAYVVREGDHEVRVEPASIDGEIVDIVVGGRRRRVIGIVPEAGRVHLAMDRRSFSLVNRALTGAIEGDAAGGGNVTAPMHGMLLDVGVQVGDKVKVGDRIAVLEAMKMRHEITAAIDGSISEVLKQPGQQIAADDLIATIEPSAQD